ncbi:MAG: metallophosphoesterase, partial [Deltaproteobacteria bacterium]|nr:metallophosphoesterase [Deltaproteobacteria bacterium]
PKLRLLRDERVSLSEWDLDILGIEDVGCTWSRTPLQLPSLERMARARAQDRPTLLLSHRPQVFKQAERLGYPLVLSGHTHGGQVALPLFPHINIARLIGYYDRGWYRWGQSQLLVSRGVGSSGPALRINCSREIALLEFQ